MKVFARIGAAYGHDYERAVLKQQLVSDGGFEQIAILVDPPEKIERRSYRHARIIAVR